MTWALRMLARTILTVGLTDTSRATSLLNPNVCNGMVARAALSRQLKLRELQVNGLFAEQVHTHRET